MNSPPFIIRPFVLADEPAVKSILAASPQAAPWSTNALNLFSTGGMSGSRLFLVTESKGEVAGFLLGQQVADEAEILNLAVLPAYRRSGHASALLAGAIADFQARGALRIFLEVRESNAAAVSFYEKHNFAAVGRRPAYYHEPEEAALRMMRKVTDFRD
jgi:[ribosomal protein S18]-alanine N-acetyltransferase